MKTIALLLIAIAVLFPAPALRAEDSSLFSPDPPEAAAAALVEAYLPLLATGQFEQALALNDLRSMRQYLLDRRLADLKAKNPELTEKDLSDMSAQIQLNDLNPARLQDILLGVMKEAGYENMSWKIRGYAPAPEAVGGYLVRIDARTREGKDKPILLGIKKLGERWMVAPEIIEQLMGNRPVGQAVPGVPPPAEVLALVGAFWKHWQTGELNDAYGLLGAEYRARVSGLSFLQQAQEIIERIGVPSSWTIVSCREIAPALLGVGVKVQGSTALTPTIMLFRKVGETWVLDDAQFQPPRPGAPASAPAAGSPSFRSDLRPDLKPPLEPAPPLSAPAPLPVPAQSGAAAGSDPP